MTDDLEFWNEQLKRARSLDSVELRRHASVSINNRHVCQDCFCCAAWSVLSERRDTWTQNFNAALERKNNG